jgi:hypothetical protein
LIARTWRLGTDHPYESPTEDKTSSTYSFPAVNFDTARYSLTSASTTCIKISSKRQRLLDKEVRPQRNESQNHVKILQESVFVLWFELRSEVI